MKRCRMIAAAVCVLTVLLVGCGQSGRPDSVDGTTIVVNKNGGVTYYLVGDFEKEYYSLSELTSMAEEEAAEFSGTEASDGSRAVTVVQVEPLQSDESKVTVTYEFDGSDSFNRFTGRELFFGTVNEAVSRGYSLDGILKSVKDSALKTEEQLKQDGEKLLIITDARTVIYCPSKVTYLSDGAKLREDGSVDASLAEGMVYILLK